MLEVSAQHLAADVDALGVAVDHVHVERLERIARTDADRAKLRLFRSFDPDAVASGELGMDDPWYGTDPAYDQTVSAIDRGTTQTVSGLTGERDRGLLDYGYNVQYDANGEPITNTRLSFATSAIGMPNHGRKAESFTASLWRRRKSMFCEPRPRVP